MKHPDDLGVADELDRHRSDGLHEVEVAHAVHGLLDGRDDQVVDIADVGQRSLDRLRAPQLQREASSRRTEATRHGVCGRRISAGDDHLVPPGGQPLRDHQADAGAATDDH